MKVLALTVFGVLVSSTTTEALDFKDVSPQSLGAAHAYTSVVDDQSALTLNPAGLSRHSKNRLVFTSGGIQGDDFDDWQFSAGFIDGKTEDPLHFGFAFNSLRTDARKMDEYRLATSFNWENLLLVGLGNTFTNFNRAALTSEKWAYSIDAGALLFLYDVVSIGASSQNIFRTYDSVDLSRKATLGVSANFRQARVSQDVERNLTLETWEFRSGIEYRARSFSIARAGFFTNEDWDEKGYTLGLTFKLWQSFDLDLAFLDHFNSDDRMYKAGFSFKL